MSKHPTVFKVKASTPHLGKIPIVMPGTHLLKMPTKQPAPTTSDRERMHYKMAGG